MSLKIIFAGTPEFAVPSLEALLESSHEVCAVYTQPDRPAGRGRKMAMSPVKEVALAAGIPVLQPESMRDEDVQAELNSWQPDLMVVVAYGQILPRVVLETPHFGCINVHASLLPRWRGAAPIQRAIMAGDTESGVTIMQMAAGLDTGEMLNRESCPIFPNDTGQSLHDRLSILGATALINTLTLIESHSLHPEIQDENLVTYAHKLNKSDGKIDWKKSAKQIELQVRALNPWPVAYTECEEHHLRIWQAEALNENLSAEPGVVINLTQEHIEVATAEGVLRLTMIQEAGGKPIFVKDFLNARREWLKLGTKFVD